MSKVVFKYRRLNGKESSNIEFTIGEEKDLEYGVAGSFRIVDFDDRSKDLLDMGFAVYQIERLLPRYQRTNPVVAITLTFGCREPKLWSPQVVDDLKMVLKTLGNIQWDITIIQYNDDKKKNEKLDIKYQMESIENVTLFSGGMDSTSGLMIDLDNKDKTVLVSYYSKQKKLQKNISEKLGYNKLIQFSIKSWNKSSRLDNKSFYYRSFLFMSLGAAVANQFNFISKNPLIKQYENGVLALSIPPGNAYVMTKHAHPVYHEFFEKFVSGLFQKKIKIDNPSKLRTKREAIIKAQEKLNNDSLFKDIIKMTETCWYIQSNQLGKDENGVLLQKNNNEACGVCIPCIIRRTAIPNGNFSYDIIKSAANRRIEILDNNVSGVNFRAYLSFVQEILLTFSEKDGTITELRPHEFYSILPPGGRDLIDSKDVSLEDLHSLFARFALEFRETYSDLFRI